MKRFWLTLLALVLLAACSSGGGAPKPSPLINKGHVGHWAGFGLLPPQPRPNFTLTDVTGGASVAGVAGKKFAFGSTTSGHPTFLYFGYTRCPDVCPETMADVGIALRHVSPAIARRTYVVFVTTDVKHDTARVIRRWLGHFSAGTHAHWVGLTGTRAELNAAQAAAHVAVATDGGQTHSAELLLFGTDNYAHVTYSPMGGEQKEIAHDLPLVARSRS